MNDGKDVERFLAALAAEAGTPILDAEECSAVLDLARIVAHETERRLAPLTAYALGLALDPSLPPAARSKQARDLADAVRRLAAGAGPDAPDSGESPEVGS